MAIRTRKPPAFRRLRGYAIDPGLSTSLSTAQVNELVYKVAWETLGKRTADSPDSVPQGEYLEIVDYDPATGAFYEPVNLDDPWLLAQDGLDPAVSNPQFHQQMVYAVMMTTIGNFERALGRRISWAENLIRTDASNSNTKRARSEVKFEFVQRLRVYPHALRQANAYYDPNRKALLFGYFQATPANAQLQLPGSTVFTCLSHDIIAHETTHAILDGLHRRFIDPTHPDTRAFHEAFADIVALFQHFTFPEVLKHQIAETRGDLKRQNLLGQLAQQFGQAIGGYGSLRDAIGRFDSDGHWSPHVPDPADYQTVMQPHHRGGILVGAVFDAFLNIYQTRVRRVFRLASGGTGLLPDGDLHPDVIDEMAKVAALVAADVLRMSIRALDYCPPMDITFGDFLRALLTADADMVVEDHYRYRVAFVEAFQKRGISATGIRSMAVEDLTHEANPLDQDSDRRVEEIQRQIGGFLRELKQKVSYQTTRRDVYEQTKEFIRGTSGLHKLVESAFASADGRRLVELTGMMFPNDKAKAEKLGLEFGYLTRRVASYAISNVWLANRVTPDGNIVNHVIVTLAQKRGVRFKVDEDDNVTVDEKGFFAPDRTPRQDWGDNHIVFRGGCTLIFDLEAMKLRYAVSKNIDDRQRMIRQFRFEKGLMGEDGQTYFDSGTLSAVAGPFAFMHSHSVARGGHHEH
jgi:hypothetical protein